MGQFYHFSIQTPPKSATAVPVRLLWAVPCAVASDFLALVDHYVGLKQRQIQVGITLWWTNIAMENHHFLWEKSL